MTSKYVKFFVEEKELHGKYFFTGFHGVGHVGWITIRHLVTKLKAKRIGYVVSYFMQPFVTVKEGITLPYEFYKKDDIVFFVANVPMSKKDLNIVSMEVAEKIAKSEIEESILIGGLDARLKDKEQDFRIAPTSTYYRNHEDEIKSRGYKLLEEGLGIIGPLAYFLSVFEAVKHPAVAILPYAAVERPDPKAAARAIDVISEITGLKIDTQELIEEGMMIEKEIAELEKRMRESMREKETPPYYI